MTVQSCAAAEVFLAHCHAAELTGCTKIPPRHPKCLHNSQTVLLSWAFAGSWVTCIINIDKLLGQSKFNGAAKTIVFYKFQPLTKLNTWYRKSHQPQRFTELVGNCFHHVVISFCVCVWKAHCNRRQIVWKGVCVSAQVIVDHGDAAGAFKLQCLSQ